MEISLKVELTDEQYQNLMQSSYDEIFKDPTTLETFRSVILEHFIEYFNDNRYGGKKETNGVYVGQYIAKRNIVEKALLDEYTDGSSYGSRTNYKPTEFLDAIVHEATKEQIQDFQTRIQQVTKEILSNPDAISKILSQVIVESIKLGFSTGNERILQDQIMQTEMVGIIQDRLFNMQNS